MRAQPGPELAMPFGVLDFQGVQRGEQRFSLGPGVGDTGPGADIAVSRRLPAVLQLGYLRGRPGERVRDLSAGQPGLLAKLAESLPQRMARLMNAEGAKSSTRRQSLPVEPRGARQHRASNRAAR